MERRCGLAASMLAWLLVASSALALDSGPEMHIAVSPDGKQVAANIYGRADICLFDAATGRQHRILLTGDMCERHPELDAYPDSVEGLAYSHGGRYLAAATPRQVVLLWDLQANDPPAELKLAQWTYRADFRFSADDKSIIAFVRGSSEAHDYLVAWDVKTAKETWRRDLGMDAISCCHLYPDGTALIKNKDGLISQASPSGKKTDYQFRPDGRPVLFSQDGKVAAQAVIERHFPERPANVELKETTTDRTITEISNDEFLCALALSTDGSLVAIGLVGEKGNKEKYRIDIHTIKDGKLIRQIRPNNDITGLCFFSDNRRLIAGSGWSGLRIWDVSTGNSVANLAYPDPDLSGGGIGAGGGVPAAPTTAPAR